MQDPRATGDGDRPDRRAPLGALLLAGSTAPRPHPTRRPQRRVAVASHAWHHLTAVFSLGADGAMHPRSGTVAAQLRAGARRTHGA